MEPKETDKTENKPEVKGRTNRLMKKIGNYIYDNSEVLGRDAFGTVYKGYEHSKTENKVAIKVILEDLMMKHGKDIFMREIEVLKKAKGKHILEFLNAYVSDSGNFYIVTSFCNEEYLSNYKNRQGGRLPVGKALQVLLDTAQAFCEIEALQLRDEEGKLLAMMHRDLKPENILMRDGTAILAEFGFAKFVEEEEKSERMNHTMLGTQIYMSPQLLEVQSYSYKCDIWAMGIVIYELIFGKKPWESQIRFNLLEKIKEEPLMFPDSIPNDVEELLLKMLSIEEEERPDWKEILEHPAIKEIELKELDAIDNTAKENEE